MPVVHKGKNTLKLFLLLLCFSIEFFTILPKPLTDSSKCSSVIPLSKYSFYFPYLQMGKPRHKEIK